MKFPKQIFVTAEDYLAASTTMEDAFDGTQSAGTPVIVGIYKLDRVEAVTRELKSAFHKEK